MLRTCECNCTYLAFNELTDYFVVKIIDWGPLDSLLNILFLFCFQCQFNKDLLKLLINKINTKLFKSIFLKNQKKSCSWKNFGKNSKFGNIFENYHTYQRTPERGGAGDLMSHLWRMPMAYTCTRVGRVADHENCAWLSATFERSG